MPRLDIPLLSPQVVAAFATAALLVGACAAPPQDQVKAAKEARDAPAKADPGATKAGPTKGGPAAGAEAKKTFIMGVPMPSGCAKYLDASRVGNEGVPTTEIWVACPQKANAVRQHLAILEKVGQATLHSMGRWKVGDVVVTPGPTKKRPSGSGTPPEGMPTVVSFTKTGKAPPCPPCTPDTKPPPGCSCP